MRSRIADIIKHYNISGREFGRRINKSEGFSNTVKDNIGIDVVRKILDEFPSVDLFWLVTGKGEMLKQDSPAVNVRFVETPDAFIESYTGLAIEVGQLKEKLKQSEEEIRRLKSTPKMYELSNLIPLVAAEPTLELEEEHRQE